MAQGSGGGVSRGMRRRPCADRCRWFRVWAVVKFLVFPLAVVALMVASPDRATAAYINDCPAQPADTGPGITNDAAIEVRELRQETAAMCAAIVERLEAPLPLAESDPDQHDLLELGAWGPLLTLGAILFLVTAPIWSRAFRMWDDV